MELTTPSGRAIDPNGIDYILWGQTVGGIPGILVQLKTAEEVFLENSEEEVYTGNEQSCRQARDQDQVFGSL